MSHNSHEEEISIRTATESDSRALRRLAQRDCARVPEGPLLIAAVDGEIRAAISLVDRRQEIADPFQATARLLTLLRLEASNRATPERRVASGRSLRLPRGRTALRGAAAAR